jgi:NitT/TauT family transport system ATP-binding protein
LNARPQTTQREIIRIESVDLVYVTGGTLLRALKDITLTADDGEFVAVVGPSGCGKSTLLKVVAGLLPSTSGVVRVNGRIVEGPPSSIGVVFQSPLLMPWRDVLGNVLVQIEMRGLPASRYRPVALELLNLVGLAGFERAHPHQLSGGMQQRVGLCRALVHDPQLLLMDEPFGALDALTREQMAIELQRIWMERKKTVLFITHSISEAIILADRVLIMSPRPGRVLSDIRVDLPRPRRMEDANSADFARLANEVRSHLRSSGAID